MNHPHAHRTCFYRPSILVAAVALLIVINRFDALADLAPQFAFSIGSNQIPGGIWPVAVGSDAAGKVYISSLSSVIKLDANGSLLNRWGSQGTGPGQFSYAGPIAFDDSGHLFVVDDYNNRVEEFDTDGNYLNAWGTYGDKPGQFNQPGGLAVSRSGKIYVSDTLNFRVQIFSGPGVFEGQFGTIGTNMGQFSFPGPLCVDSSNYVYVVDSPGGAFPNFRVQQFDENGKFLQQWGPSDPNFSNAIQIGGIAVDPQNNVYIADGSNNRVQKFTSDGVLLAEWGSSGSGPGQFNTPSGIAIAPSGNYVYVPDYYNARINVFAYAGLGPLIYQPPTNEIVPAGSTLALDSGVFGALPISYQWYFNGSPIPAQNAPSLVVSNVPLTASGSYSVSVSNSLGNASTQNAAVTVLPVVANTLPASGISSTGVVLNGNVWLGATPSTVWFEWGTNSSYGEIAGLTHLAPNVQLNLSTSLAPLTGEVIYHYRLVGSNSLGLAYGQDASFEIGLKPFVKTLAVTPTGPDSVSLNALVNPEARNTSVFFRWGRYNLYQYNTPTNQLPNMATAALAQSSVTGLVAGVIYSYQPVASNELGTVSGAIVSFTAPPWTLLQPPTASEWDSVAVSADGGRLAATAPNGRMYTSADSGGTWSSNSVPAAPWQAVTVSADGSRLVAVAGGSFAVGPAYFSTNSGRSWIKSNMADRHWYALASSGDGQSIVATDPIAQSVLISTNGGLNWRTNSPEIQAMWSSVASSADAHRLIVSAGGVDHSTNGPVYTSLDGGLSWTSNNLPVSSWRSVASSADGEVLLAAVGGITQTGPIYISTNSGLSWAPANAPMSNWQSVAVSADGSVLAALARVEAAPLLLSTNLGVSWEPFVLPPAIWSDLVLSADGARVVVSGDQNIFMLQTKPSLRLGLSISTGALSLSWVIPSVPVGLQKSTDLLNPQWTNQGFTPTALFTNLHETTTLPATSSAGFYRLQIAQ